MEVALAFGFSSHANFTRAFKQAYGITPEEYRNHPRVLHHFLKPDLNLHYVTFEENSPIITDGMTLEIGRETLQQSLPLVGIRGSIPMDELKVGRVPGVAKAGALWNQYHAMKNGSPELLDGDVEAAVLTLQPNQDGDCTYFVGGEASMENPQAGFETEIIPQGEYVVCKFEAQDFLELIHTAVFKSTTFMQKWNQAHHLICGEFAYEIYAPQKADAFHMSLMLLILQAPEQLPADTIPDISDGTQRPTLAGIKKLVNSTLWDQLIEFLEGEIKANVSIEYSRCSMQPGWNVKYKKAGRSMCTLYPQKDAFTAMVVIGKKEREETESVLLSFTPDVQRLYHETKLGMDQRWLMIDVTDKEILEDVKTCISIRRWHKSNRR